MDSNVMETNSNKNEEMIIIKSVRPNDCCNLVKNMTVEMEGVNNELEVQLCKICGCRHRRLIVERADFKIMEAV